MKTLNQFMAEAIDRPAALLPATKTLWDKNKVTVKDINKMWPKGKHTIQVTHHNGDPKKPRFIFGSGHTEHKDNQVIHARHDQTRAHLGTYHVHNTIHVTDGNIVKSAKAVDADQKAPVLVYK